MMTTECSFISPRFGVQLAFLLRLTSSKTLLYGIPYNYVLYWTHGFLKYMPSSHCYKSTIRLYVLRPKYAVKILCVVIAPSLSTTCIRHRAKILRTGFRLSVVHNILYNLHLNSTTTSKAIRNNQNRLDRPDILITIWVYPHHLEKYLTFTACWRCTRRVLGVTTLELDSVRCGKQSR